MAGGNTLTCNFGTMAPLATKSITLTATTSAGNCPAINNTATVSSDGDTNSSNNTSGPVKITVNCAADVKVSQDHHHAHRHGRRPGQLRHHGDGQWARQLHPRGPD